MSVAPPKTHSPASLPRPATTTHCSNPLFATASNIVCLQEARNGEKRRRTVSCIQARWFTAEPTPSLRYVCFLFHNATQGQDRCDATRKALSISKPTKRVRLHPGRVPAFGGSRTHSAILAAPQTPDSGTWAATCRHRKRLNCRREGHTSRPY